MTAQRLNRHKQSKPPMKKRPVLRHGGGTIEVPLLSAPVGRASPALLAKFPGMNAAADVAIVDHYLTRLEAIKYLDASARAHPLGTSLMFAFGAVDAVSVWDDRDAAIAALQSRLGVKDTEETQHGLIKPDGETLIALVDYGDLAEKLLEASQPPVPLMPMDYIHSGLFDKTVFRTEFISRFVKTPRYDAAAIPALMTLLGFLERDRNIIDVRWMAYMLATVNWETTYPKSVLIPVLNKKGQPLKDKKGNPVMRTQKRWATTMAPVDEVGHGAGRDYYLPVKVKRLPNSGARVTEQDGDQFTVTTNGRFAAVNKGAKLGSSAAAKSTSTYDSDDGDEQSYFGRGYVQLTWWSNYARAGAAIGHGLDLLFDPELVKDPQIAYTIMSHGMRTGEGFANGKRFANYFYGTHADYVHARAMVNGADHRNEIAQLARSFEGILLKAKR